MNYRKNRRFFEKLNWLGTFGLCTLIFGFFLFIFFKNGVLKMGGIALCPVGLLLFIWNGIVCATEKDIRRQTADICRDIDPRAEIDAHPRLSRRLPPVPEEYTFEGRAFRDGVTAKRCFSGTILSAEYDCVKAVFLTDEIFACRKVFSLIEPKERNETYEIPYASVTDVRIEREKFTLPLGKTAVTVPLCFLTLDYDGKTVRFPVADDATTEDLRSHIAETVRLKGTK